MSKPRILFFGTSDFAIPALDAIIDKKFEIAGVITTPDEPAGRGRTLTSPPVKTRAGFHSIQVFQPIKLSQEIWQETMPEADLFIVAAYGKILPAWLLALPKYGTLNIHPSLLPKYRGPSPIQSTLVAGDKKTGVTIMLMDKEIDHGPIIALQVVPIDKDDTAITLSQKLSRIGAEILCESISEWISGSLKPIEQDHTKATFTKIIKKEDGRIDWHAHADEIANKIRAYAEWPKCWTTLENKRVIILKAHATNQLSQDFEAGAIQINDGQILVATGDYFLSIDELQPENKKSMRANAFLAGRRISTLTKFI